MEITIPNLSKLQSLAEQAPASFIRHTTAALRLALARIRREVIQEAPFGVSGNLRDNWEMDVQDLTGTLRSRAPYAVGVNFGTRPHYVSPKTLEPWAKKKGLNPFAVAKGIAKKGTKANPFFNRAVTKAEPNVNLEMGKAINNIIKDLTL